MTNAVTVNTYPTLIELAARLDGQGKIDTIVEMLTQTNEVLDDMSWMEGNLPTGHRTTVRLSLPSPTWRAINEGVFPTKSTTSQITDTCAMLEAYAETDKALADLNGNTAAFRLSEERAFIEGINQEFTKVLFKGSIRDNSKQFNGFSTRYGNVADSNLATNIILANKSLTNSTGTSIWLVVWGNNTVHGIYPKGSKVGLSVEDKGQVTIENVDGAGGGRMEAYRTHYRWDCGLTIRDWRYVVRIANIDQTTIQNGPLVTGAPDIVNLMMRAIERIPTLGMGRAAFYCNRSISAYLRAQIVDKVKQSTLTMDTVAGKRVLAFDGIPVRRVDALRFDEAPLTATYSSGDYVLATDMAYGAAPATKTTEGKLK